MSIPVMYETHSHTYLCRHATGEPNDYVKVAQQRGLKGIFFTCHNPIPGGRGVNVRMSCEELPVYLNLVEELRQAWLGRMDVRLGLESDFFPGAESWLEELHQKAAFNYILGSVHPQIKEYIQRYRTGSTLDYQRTYFQHLAEAAETGLFNSISHPDIIKNMNPDEWQISRVMDEIKRSLDRIASTGVAMELNTSGVNKEIPEMNPGRDILEQMRLRNIPVVLGGDAHHPSTVGASFPAALDLLEEVGFSHINIFLERKRHEIDIAEARASLNSCASTPPQLNKV